MKETGAGRALEACLASARLGSGMLAEGWLLGSSLACWCRGAGPQQEPGVNLLSDTGYLGQPPAGDMAWFPWMYPRQGLGFPGVPRDPKEESTQSSPISAAPRLSSEVQRQHSETQALSQAECPKSSSHLGKIWPKGIKKKAQLLQVRVPLHQIM